MDWDKLKIFHAVAEAGNFTKATYILNLSQSAISRQIQSLEQELKVAILKKAAILQKETTAYKRKIIRKRRGTVLDVDNQKAKGP